MSVQVTDRDTGLARVIRELRKLKGGNVSIGIHQEDAERDGDGPSNVLIGSVHEFGAPDHKPPIPARPFLRPGVKAAAAAISREMSMGVDAIVDGSGTARQTLQRMGEVALQSVLQRITDGIKPPLAPATILQRLRRTKKGRTIVNAAGRASRSLKAGNGRAATWSRATFGKRADGSHGHIAGSWKIKGKGNANRANKALANLAKAMGGSFTPLVDTGQLRASLAYVATEGAV